MSDIETLGEERLEKLDNEQKRWLASCINFYGSNDHPMADTHTLYGFARDYAKECVDKAIADERRMGAKTARIWIQRLETLKEAI